MYYYGARYYDPKMSLFVSVDPLAEQFQGWSPYNYTMNNPLNLVDPTGMAPENPDGPPPPKKGAKTDPITQGSYNVAKKYVGLGLSVAADPIGTAISVGKGLGQELSDFVGRDGARLDNTLLRKGGEAFDSYVSRVSGSSDPAYEHQVILAEMATEIAASALVTKGAGALIGKAGTEEIGNIIGNSLDDVSRFGTKSEGLGHFSKHGTNVQNALNKSSYNYGDYLTDANYIINNGTYIPELNGYAKLIGGKGSAKFGFVGLNRQTGNITTFHIKTAKELSKNASKRFKY